VDGDFPAMVRGIRLSYRNKQQWKSQNWPENPQEKDALPKLHTFFLDPAMI